MDLGIVLKPRPAIVVRDSSDSSVPVEHLPLIVRDLSKRYKGGVWANRDINLTGNPGMASGGMGDVLGGLVAGLAAQGLAPFDAACAGVYLHGRAGDRVAWRTSQAGMSAGDVIEELPDVFRELRAR